MRKKYDYVGPSYNDYLCLYFNTVTFCNVHFYVRKNVILGDKRTSSFINLCPKCHTLSYLGI